MALGIGISGPRGGGGGAIPSLSIEVYSDAGYTIPVASLAYGATAYVKLVASDIIPTTHTLFFGNGTKNAPQVTQAGDTLAWTVSLTGSVIISATATDGTDATADATPFTLTSTLVIDHALNFDGVNDFAVGTSLLDIGSDFSVTNWFKFNTIANFVPIFGLAPFHSPLAKPSFGCGFDYRDNQLKFFGWNNEWTNNGLTITPDLNWHHLAVNYDYSSQTVTVYLDNSLLGSMPSFNVSQPIDGLILGRFGDWPYVGGKYGSLRITDVRLNPNVLSLAQIDDVYNGLPSGDEIQWYAMDEPVGQPLRITDFISNQKASVYNTIAPYGIIADAP